VSSTLQTCAGPVGLGEYQPQPGTYDEGFVQRGVPRPHYARLFAALDGAELGKIGDAVARDLHRHDVTFRTGGGSTPFRVDPIPRLLTTSEWAALAEGLVQRVQALNAFIVDVYSERAIVSAGRMPEAVIESAEHYEPAVRGLSVARGVYAAVAGLDVVRDANGAFKVLEDNLRTPSGLAYAAAAREALERNLPIAKPRHGQDLGQAFLLLGCALRALAPDGSGDPSIVLLSDGPENSAWYEHRVIARRLEIPLVTLGDLYVSAGRLKAHVEDRVIEVQVVYRRTDEDRLTDDAGRETALAQALLEPCRRRRLACLNAFGAGVADDKLVHSYVEEMIRFYLGEEPLLPSVPTYDVGDAERRADVIDRLEELVLKPRTGHGGHGVMIGPQASAAERAQAIHRLEQQPHDFVAQETVRLSAHPTVCRGERLEPRHVDLRPFIVSAGGDATVVSCGLTRVAFERGSLVVNSSQRGGGKDTWVTDG
jgi:uncharacterized circularly permuted ATP-grasp superfamily protein